MTITRSPYISNPDILFCHEARSTRPVALDFGEADMLPAGTLISCEGKAVNDLTALGVLLYDTWKGYGSGQGVVLISGHVDLVKAQEHSGLTYSAEAKAALKGICFVGDTEVPSGGGVSSWNDLTDKPFGETTVMGDTLTWDGDMTGREKVAMPTDDGEVYFVHVSDSVPTLEELQNGGTVVVSEAGETMTIEHTADMWFNHGGIFSNEGLEMPLIVTEDNLSLEGIGTFPKKGVYFMHVSADGMIVKYTSFTINNYTGFETTEVKTIDPKYLPTTKNKTIFYCSDIDGNNSTNRAMYIDEALTTLATPSEVYDAHVNSNIVIVDPSNVIRQFLPIDVTFAIVNGTVYMAIVYILYRSTEGLISHGCNASIGD